MVENIYQLLEALKSGEMKLDDKLPVFSNPDFNNTSGMWSWDKEYALRGTCLDDLEIVLLNPEDKKEMFLERLAEYLSNPIGNGCDWPEISRDQMLSAREILDDLLRLKFIHDCDGDSPLRVHITNNSVERQVFPMTIPHKGDYKNPLENGGKLDKLLTGVNYLTEELNSTMNLYQMQKRHDEENDKKNKERETAGKE